MSSTYSLSLNGSSGYVDLGNPAALSGLQSTEITLAGWIKPATISSGTMGLIYERSAGATSCLIGLELNRTGGHLSVNVAENILLSSSSTLTASAWHHVALVRSGTPGAWTLTLYIDGTAAGSTGTVVNSDSSIAWAFGRPGGFSGQYFSGLMDDVAIVGSALSGTDIANLAAGTVSPSSFSPVGYWPLEEGTGTTTADTSGNGNTGTLTGGVTWSSDVPSQLAPSGGSIIPLVSYYNLLLRA